MSHSHAEQLMLRWPEVTPAPFDRREKPRTTGVTMLIDKGLGPVATADLLETAGEHIDFAKVAIGTAPLYPVPVLRQKLRLYAGKKVATFPGGTLFEVAHSRGQLARYLQMIRDVGFDSVEVSDGTLPLTPAARVRAIEQAASLDLKVITEVGRKDPMEEIVPSQVAATVEADRAAGASYVIIEARESGIGVGIFDRSGHVRPRLFEALVTAIVEPEHVIWEAPLHEQQAFLIRALGPEVNLGNVRPEDALVLEALRRGLRWETLREALVIETPVPSEEGH
jgi:phosphosulfolactate synthase